MNTFSVIIPLLTAVIGPYLTYYFTNRSKRYEAIVKYKEGNYSKLLLALHGFVGITANAKSKRELFEEQHQSWLYCSNKVVKAMNYMVTPVINSKGKNPVPVIWRSGSE
jgi:hypothetical protein